MKRSRRESNEIIIGFMFYSVLVLILLYVLIGYLYPKIVAIENTKEETKKILSNISTIKKEGIDYSTFKRIVKTGKVHEIEMLKILDENMYRKNLTNTGNTDFMLYLNTLESKVFNDENKKIIANRLKKISKILPSYIEGDKKINIEEDNKDNKERDLLTNFKFINYLELLFETFDLKYKSSLGISNIVFLEEYGSEGNNLSESNIFYIPLTFNLEGSKKSILNFLYYIENVGNITVRGKNSIQINKNYGFLSYNGVDLVLEGEYGGPNYNIFEHQIADIESITMKKYLDSSMDDRGEKSFINFIKEEQGKENMSINVKLRFYIKGLSIYELEKGIEVIVNKYKNLNKIVNKTLANKKLKLDKRNEFKKYNSTLKVIGNSIKNMGKKDKLEDKYKQALKFNSILNNIEIKINNDIDS